MNESFQFYDYHPPAIDMFSEVVEGLSTSPRTLSPKFFYDEQGSHLFDAICETSEYYQTRTEISIIRSNITDIADCIGSDCLLLEPGSGNSRKVRELLPVIEPHAYMPMEISKSHLQMAASQLSNDYPWLNVHAVCTDYTNQIELPYDDKGRKKIAFFPGSTIGNFEPQEAISFLANIAHLVQPGGGLLIGVDLKKPVEILHAAYNDAQGITSAFNLNLLQRINRDLGANFDVEQFQHDAFYNSKLGRIEMHLISQSRQVVSIGEYSTHFEQGENIHTENSYKFTVDEFQQLARQAGFEPQKVWKDPDNLFSVHYLVVR